MAKPEMSNVVALVNPKSGERASAVFLFDELNRILPGRVIDLSTCFEDQSAAIACIESHAVRGTVIVAGGDGTVSWGMDIVDRCNWAALGEENKPHITVIPMGTGNDLSRSLGFGPGFAHITCCCGCCACCRIKALDETVDHSCKGAPSQMDRWDIRVIGAKGTEIERRVMNNYFSIGFDAHIAKMFDKFRKDHPSLCKARFMNKVWYGFLGTRALCGEPVLHKSVKLFVDGKDVDIPEGIKSLVVSNVDSFAGGVKLWNDKRKRFSPVSVGDGLVEIQGIYGSTHMGFMQMKLRNAMKIAQGSVVQIVVSDVHWMQWDGEAMDKVKEPCTINITHHSSPKILSYRK